MGHVGPTIKKKKNHKGAGEDGRRGEMEKFLFLFYFISSLSSLFDIWKSDRRNSSEQEEKCSTRRGLRLGTKNMGFRLVFN